MNLCVCMRERERIDCGNMYFVLSIESMPLHNAIEIDNRKFGSQKGSHTSSWNNEKIWNK